MTKSAKTYSGQVNQTMQKWFNYDHAGRLEKTEQQIGSDARGRPTQTVAANQSWFFNDMVTGVGYDSFGRQDKTYLPSTNHGRGNAVASLENNISSFYNGVEGNPLDGIMPLVGYQYTQTQYEASPLNRVSSVTDPAGGITNYTYGTNATGEVINWGVENDNCVKNNTYEANELIMTQTTDPSGNIVKEYKDKLGKVILKMAGSAKTYYVYDNFDLLRYVLSPKAVECMTGLSYSPTSSEVKGLCYYYQYDDHKRMVEKQLPGADPVLMVYDNRDRLVMVQDGNTRAENPEKWVYTKHDNLNRPIETGYLTYGDTWENIQDYFSDRIGFTDHIGCNLGEVLTQTSYDSYPNPGLCTLPTMDNAVNGKVTWQKAKMLDGSGYRQTYFFYDNKYRPVQITVQGGLVEQTTLNTYDFAGRVTESTDIYSGQVSQTLTKTFTYDHAGRLEKVEQQIEGDNVNGKVVLAQSDYNDLGQLMLKKQHSANANAFAQNTDYLYDVRGWLKSINNLEDASTQKLYAQDLAYNANGNIGSITWKNTLVNLDNSIVPSNRQRYDFTYDAMNRLDNASYSEVDPSNQAVSSKAGFFNENPDYDLNGNIIGLVRQGNTFMSGFHKGTIDNLGYVYRTNSNQVNNITDIGEVATHGKEFKPLAGNFAYDANGNATTIPQKQSTIVYNYLNLPSQVVIAGQGTISYLYDASGNKLKKSFAGKDSYYQGSVLKIDGKTMVLTGEGRAVKNQDGTWDYEYDLKDHLGNTRVSFAADNSDINVLQTKDYYPFGMEMVNGYSNSADATKYLYNGKELQDEGGLDFYDYGARFYDPSLGRWHSVDPSCEDGGQESLTAYQYGLNNPVRYNDPDGRCPSCIIGGIIGAAVDYGEQVATNYIEGNQDPWTNNINLTSIGTSAVAGFATSGGSALESLGAKIAVKAGASLINNTVKVSTSSTGLKTTIESNAINVVKNAAIDLAVDGVAGKAAGKVQGALSKVGVTNAGRLSSTTKAVVNAMGQNVTRSTTATVKAGLNVTTKVVANTVESTAKVTTNSKRDELKEKTNL